MFGLGAHDLSGKPAPFEGVGMRRTEALQGVRVALFLNLLRRWGQGSIRRRRPNCSGVDARTFRRRTRRKLGLHLAQAASAVKGRRCEGAAQGGASAQARATTVAGNA